jgi:YD repeat-containing protein
VGIGNEKAPVEQRRYTYDAKFNQLTSATDELGHKTLYDLDSNTGNVLKTTRVVGALDAAINGETNDVVTSFTYTSTGQVDLVTDALGRITDYDYVYGDLIKLTTAEGTVDQTVEQYEYDLAGNLTAIVDPLGHRMKYVYNSTNMLLQTIDALGGTTTYNYDKMGHQTSMTDALGHVTKMSYDSRGRLIKTIDALNQTFKIGYDAVGNIVSQTDELGRTTGYSYDVLDRRTGVTDALGHTSTYTRPPAKV